MSRDMHHDYYKIEAAIIEAEAKIAVSVSPAGQNHEEKLNGSLELFHMAYVAVKKIVDQPEHPEDQEA